ncbi:MAG TPA: DUF4402 domain-containing protein [Bacteroidales bacterium]|jgi:hypothetical protein|nr:DUF4402 domain-containing protein [Bacteroidales bacterium]
MISEKTYNTKSASGWLPLIMMVVLFGSVLPLMAQEPPPRPVIITANPSQPLAFGAFTPGAAGGTITVPPDGSSRTTSGTVITLNLGMMHTPAMFYIRANPGTVISLLAGPPSPISGSNGGTLYLQLDDTYPASPLVTMVPYQQQTTVLVGGTLTVGTIGSNPPGNYSGTINVTFVQE